MGLKANVGRRQQRESAPGTQRKGRYTQQGLGRDGWFVEQLVHVDFEFLSVSYIATELLLLSVHSMLQDYGILTAAAAQAASRDEVENSSDHPCFLIPMTSNGIFITNTTTPGVKKAK